MLQACVLHRSHTSTFFPAGQLPPTRGDHRSSRPWLGHVYYFRIIYHYYLLFIFFGKYFWSSLCWQLPNQGELPNSVAAGVNGGAGQPSPNFCPICVCSGVETLTGTVVSASGPLSLVKFRCTSVQLPHKFQIQNMCVHCADMHSIEHHHYTTAQGIVFSQFQICVTVLPLQNHRSKFNSYYILFQLYNRNYHCLF